LINGHKLTENNSDQMDTIQWTIDTFSSKYSIQYSQTVACIYHIHILQWFTSRWPMIQWDKLKKQELIR